jgi:hypothetical protein
MKHEMEGFSAKDLRLPLDTTRVIVAVGRPGNLSRITNETWTIKKIRHKFAEPSVDSSMTFAKYQKLKDIGNDKGHAKQKEAADIILSAKAAPGNWTAARYKSTRRKVGEVEAKTMVVLDVDHATPEQTYEVRQGLRHGHAGRQLATGQGNGLGVEAAPDRLADWRQRVQSDAG